MRFPLNFHIIQIHQTMCMYSHLVSHLSLLVAYFRHKSSTRVASEPSHMLRACTETDVSTVEQHIFARDLISRIQELFPPREN